MTRWRPLPGREGQAATARAWTASEVREAVSELLDQTPLPPPDARVFVKPNLNSDLPALMGNSTDLRLLAALLSCLQERGFRRVWVGDGSNVGVHRRSIPAAARLGVERLCARHDARWLDLNQAPWRMARIAGRWLPVAAAVLDADFVIALPKLKTHQEAGLSLVAKLFVGAVVGQAKREVHRDLARSIVDLGALFRPDLTIVDGLVAMEGNGPGDGRPRRLDLLVAGRDPWLVELACCRLIGLPWEHVPSLVLAARQGYFGAEQLEAVSSLQPLASLAAAPPPPLLQRLASARVLRGVKQLVLPAMEEPAFRDLMYRLGVVQDRYERGDEPAVLPARPSGRPVDDVVGEVCPDGLDAEAVGTARTLSTCLQCGYCRWAGGEEQVPLAGRPTAWQALQLGRFGTEVQAALRRVPDR